MARLPTTPLNEEGLPQLELATMADGETVICFSKLEVLMLPAAEEALVRENKFFQQASALHTHPIATGPEPAEPAAPPSPKKAAA